MSTPKGILDQLVTQFKNSSNLSSVNDNSIMKGDQDVERYVQPSILIEPVRNPEEIDELGYNDVTMNLYLRIIGIVKNENHDDCIDAMLDLEANIKKAIYEDPQINDQAIYTYIIDTAYNRLTPLGEVIIDVRIEYTQDKELRT